jgi:hypothetical protein
MIDVSVTGWRKSHPDDPEHDGNLRERILKLRERLRKRARAVDMWKKPSAIVFKRGRRGR